MSEQPTTQAPEEKVFTAEERHNQDRKIREFYKNQISFLKLQAEYETLRAEIEEGKLRQMMAMRNMSHLYAEIADVEAEKQAAATKGEPQDAPVTESLKPEIKDHFEPEKTNV